MKKEVMNKHINAFLGVGLIRTFIAEIQKKMSLCPLPLKTSMVITPVLIYLYKTIFTYYNKLNQRGTDVSKFLRPKRKSLQCNQ